MVHASGEEITPPQERNMYKGRNSISLQFYKAWYSLCRALDLDAAVTVDITKRVDR